MACDNLCQTAICLDYCLFLLGCVHKSRGTWAQKPKNEPSTNVGGRHLAAHSTIYVLEPHLPKESCRGSQEERFVFFKFSFLAVLNASIWGGGVVCSRPSEEMSHWRLLQNQHPDLLLLHFTLKELSSGIISLWSGGHSDQCCIYLTNSERYCSPS